MTEFLIWQKIKIIVSVIVYLKFKYTHKASPYDCMLLITTVAKVATCLILYDVYSDVIGNVRD